MDTFCFSWNNFEQNLSSAFQQLRNNNDFLDVTLVSEEGDHLSAHKAILSTSSDFFQEILTKANHTNPLLFLSGFNFKVLTAVLDFIYNGKVNLYQEEVDMFLESAQKLKIHGLTQKLQEEKKETTFVENEVYQSNFACSSYLKEGEENSNATSLQEATIEKETTVETIVSPNVTRCSNLNYDEHITKCKVGWKCNFCGKTKTTKANMNLHVEIHIDGLSFPCKFCAMNFRSRNVLNSHTNRAHK